MEKSHARKGHDHIVFIASFDNVVVSDGSAGLGNVGHAALMSALDVVTEGEESVRTKGYSLKALKICSLLFPTLLPNSS